MGCGEESIEALKTLYSPIDKNRDRRKENKMTLESKAITTSEIGCIKEECFFTKILEPLEQKWILFEEVQKDKALTDKAYLELSLELANLKIEIEQANDIAMAYKTQINALNKILEVIPKRSEIKETTIIHNLDQIYEGLEKAIKCISQ
jgi:hypothetical protein